MDIKLNVNQIKQISSALSLNDVLNCIKEDYDSYLQFLKEELDNKEITKEEYEKELLSINNFIQQKSEEVNV